MVRGCGIKVLLYCPTSNGGVQKKEAKLEHVRVAYTFLHIRVPTCTLSRSLPTKISASELTRKSIKSALLVG